MIPTLALDTIVQKLLTVISTDAAILTYCVETWDTPLKVYVGVPRKHPPTQTDCPYVVIRPGAKTEGAGQSENTYAVAVGWSILSDVDPTVTVLLDDDGTPEVPATIIGTTIEAPGFADCDALGQLLLAAIDGASSDNPIWLVDYEVECVEFLPQVVGDMQIEFVLSSSHAGALAFE